MHTTTMDQLHSKSIEIICTELIPILLGIKP